MKVLISLLLRIDRRPTRSNALVTSCLRTLRECLTRWAMLPRNVTKESSADTACADVLPDHLHVFEISLRPIVFANSSSTCVALGVLSVPVVFARTSERLSDKAFFHPSPAKVQALSPLFLEATRSNTTSGKARWSAACEIINSRESLARSSTYASQQATTSTIALLFSTSIPRRLPGPVPPTDAWMSSRVAVSVMLLSNSFKCGGGFEIGIYASPRCEAFHLMANA